MKLFFAFAPTESAFVKKVLTQLHVLIQNRSLVVWHPEMILAGRNTVREIEKNLQDSAGILFFLTAEFLSSQLFYDLEIEVIRRVKNETLRLLAVPVKPCLWQLTRLNQELTIQPWPSSKVLLSYERIDDAVFEMASALLNLSTNEKAVLLQEGISKKRPINNRGELIIKIKGYLTANRTGEALDAFEALLVALEIDSSSAITLRARYISILDESGKGLVSQENARIEVTRIQYYILSLLKKLKD